jgi:glycosyltransferase involved in cell wall biosynthesis
MKTKLLLFTQHFFPDKLSTGKVLSELIFGLDDTKFDISVIAGRRLYQDKTKTILAKFEKVKGIPIYRVLKVLLPKEKAWGRLFNYIAFFILSSMQALSRRLIKDSDIIFCVSDPPIMPLVGALLKNRHNKIIYLIHDLYPDIAIKLGAVSKDNIMSKLMFQLNKFVFSKADKIIVLGRDMKTYIVNKYNVSPDKLEVLTNWSQALMLPTKDVDKNDKFRLLYTGNMGRFHDLEVAVEAAAILRDELELVFVGEGAKKEKLQNMVIEKKLDNVLFYGYLEDDQYWKALSQADALLVSLEKGLAGLAVPSKFYTYLASGKPIIGVVDYDSEVALSIEEDQFGFVVGHGDVPKLVDQISYMISYPEETKQMGINAENSFQKKYETSILVNKYENLLLNLK